MQGSYEFNISIKNKNTDTACTFRFQPFAVGYPMNGTVVVNLAFYAAGDALNLTIQQRRTIAFCLCHLQAKNNMIISNFNLISIESYIDYTA